MFRIAVSLSPVFYFYDLLFSMFSFYNVFFFYGFLFHDVFLRCFFTMFSFPDVCFHDVGFHSLSLSIPCLFLYFVSTSNFLFFFYLLLFIASLHSFCPCLASLRHSILQIRIYFPLIPHPLTLIPYIPLVLFFFLSLCCCIIILPSLF